MLTLSIKQKLVALGVLFLMGSLIALAILWNGLVRMDNLARESALVNGLKADMLMLRRHEKDFLMRLDVNYQEKFQQTLADFNRDLTALDAYEPGVAAAIAGSIKQYGQQFDGLVATYTELGLDPQSGYYGRLRDAVHNAEKLIKTLQNDKLQAEMLMLRRREKDFMLRFDSKYLDQFNTDLQAMQATITAQAGAEASTLQQLMNQYSKDFRALVQAQQKIGLNADSGLLGELRETVDQVEKNLNGLIAAMDEKIAAEQTSIRTTAVLTLTVVAVLMLVLLYWLVQSIIKPIQALNTAMHSVRNNRDLSIRAQLAGKDELTQMGETFNELMGWLQDIIKSNITVSTSLNDSALELRANMQASGDTVREQDVQRAQIVSALRDIDTTAHEISQNTSIAADNAHSTHEKAEAGKQVVLKTADSIRHLASQLQGSSDKAIQLAADGERIGSVLDVIRSIAEQTNLLALNAAIEAARAGEQGRGFAVVADEVRTLAQRTQDSTEEIAAIITSLQGQTQSMVDEMEMCRSQGENSAEQATHTATLLAEITDAVSSIMDMTNQIAAAAEEQSAVLKEVNQQSQQVDKLGEKVSAMSTLTITGCDGVAQRAQQMIEVVRSFKV